MISFLDPDYQTFVANMNAPVTGADALPNAETMLEEIERKQREIHGKSDRNKYLFIVSFQFE